MKDTLAEAKLDALRFTVAEGTARLRVTLRDGEGVNEVEPVKEPVRVPLGDTELEGPTDAVVDSEANTVGVAEALADKVEEAERVLFAVAAAVTDALAVALALWVLTAVAVNLLVAEEVVVVKEVAVEETVVLSVAVAYGVADEDGEVGFVGEALLETEVHAVTRDDAVPGAETVSRLVEDTELVALSL